MNTLLGETAALNDIQYPRYRLAFKLRKLQKTLLLDQFDVGLLQEALHLSGVGSLLRNELVSVSQLHSAVVEMFSCLRLQKPVLGSASLQQAQELCSNWLQMNYQCSTGGKVEAGSLKITLCLLSGGKCADKARYLFSVLANSNGAVECCDLTFFCAVTKQLAGTLQEDLYSKWVGPKELWHNSLVFVRCAEDVEDEMEDGGGIRRQWLSQFEFSKLFTASPEPDFLRWLGLFQRLPSMEKVLHPVRCAVCTRKPIVAFRYQCTQCNNFNLCQMCFLKGRVTDKHTANHQMMEFSSVGKGQKSWHHRLVGSKGRSQGGRVFEESKSPFVYSPRTSVASMERSNHGNQVDSPMAAIADMLTSSQRHSASSISALADHTHKPTMIQIGNGDQNNTQNTKPHPQKQAPPPAHHGGKRNSCTTSSGSPDSVSSGGKFHYDAPLSSASSAEPFSTSAVSSTSDLHISPTHHMPQLQRNVSQPREDLTEINRKLSMEVDMLLSDLPGDATPAPKLSLAAHKMADLTQHGPSAIITAYKVPLGGDASIQGLQEEGAALEGQVDSLSNRREQLAGELQGLISQVENIRRASISLSHGIRTPSPGPTYFSSPLVGPAHLRSDSLPAEGYLSSGPSPPMNPSPLLHRKECPPALHGSHQLLSPTSREFPDPMAEYTPTDLDWNSNHAHLESHRLSVVW